MLDTDTKRRIDTARNLLVGKVPDPKSQVEQITIALIYKFMDDMDAEAEELGGKRKFFSGEYGKFGWAKLMQPGIGGHELLALYADGIAKMPENPGIPALFRDIFKNAYLPYRDPETLKSFLKVINEFSYDHSERLGDAFEYLLSVLGSQGDAGQFRTPRHIIDFIVEILAPRKEEVLLDPSCGTAGFLISAYKHILRSNTDAKGHSTLTPQQRGEMAKNFKGYDISPDMVRLSLVNLYLHGFTDPHIFEYDTLTDVARWNEFADVILANPPFMSPKGGIRPHNRFSIQAKRSEVLFVDYIAEHLTPNGRAGIIVPEGIIFQSQNAYKDLRRMLVENSLVAVISLPAGCFNPYSGVKTSILLLDKSLARKSQTVAFFKVENDGYDLGAQRRPIQKNDLPKVQEELESYLATLRERKDPSDLSLTTSLIVPKEKIAANGDYNLSGERYREGATRATNFPIVELGDVAEVVSGQSPPGESYNESGKGVPFYQGKTEFGEMLLGEAVKWTTDPQRYAENDDVLMSVRAPVGPVNLSTQRICIGRGLAAIRPNQKKLLTQFAFYFLKSQEKNITGDAGAAFASINKGEIEKIQIPLPPLEIQREIVAEIEGYQKIINGARAVLDNYRPHIPINPDWPMVELGDVCDGIITGPFGTALHQSDYVSEGIPVINPQNIVEGAISTYGVKMVSTETRNRLKEFTIRENDIVIGRRGEMGRCAVATSTMNGWLCGTGCFVIRLSSKCKPRFYFHQVSSAKTKAYLEEQAIGVTMKNLNQGILSGVNVPLPPLAEQQTIVAEIEVEQVLVNANRELITRFEAKIQTTLSRIWGEQKVEGRMMNDETL
jgi:type I restriction enzyme M protein